MNGKDLLTLETLAGTPSTQPVSEQPNPVRGIGGGLADMVPAIIDQEQPAALSEGEFVWPADIVSFMGNGSSEAGARVLNSVVQEVRNMMKQGDSEKAPEIAKKVVETLTEGE